MTTSLHHVIILSWSVMMLPHPTPACSSLTTLNICSEVPPDMMSMVGVVDSGSKPINTILTNPLHFFINTLIQALCFGRTGQYQKAKKIFEGQKQNFENHIILEGNRHSVIIDTIQTKPVILHAKKTQ